MFINRKSPMFYILVLCLWSLLFVMITGCGNTPEFKEGYPSNDIEVLSAAKINALDNARNVYCAEHSHPVIRKAALTVIRKQLPDAYEDGLCTRLDKIISFK